MINNNYIKGLIITTLGVLILSFDGLLIRLIGINSFDLLFWRGLFLSVVVTLWYLFRKQTFCCDYAFFRSALLFAVGTITFVSAIQLSSVANVLVIISTIPLFTALLARVFINEKLPLYTWGAILISTFGVGWIFAESWQSPNFTGDVLALTASLALSGKFVNDRAVSNRDMTPGLILAGLIIAAISTVAGQPFELAGNAWWLMLLLCLVVIPLAFILITLGTRCIPAAEVGMLMLLETATGPFWVWIWLHEAPSKTTLEGGSIIIGTLFIHGLIQWRKKQGKVQPLKKCAPV
jgi:drug/metabolite transporter (DMT)-like permease